MSRVPRCWSMAVYSSIYNEGALYSICRTGYEMLDTNRNIYLGPIIDSHIHLYDPRRRQGIPWPPIGDKIHRPTLPQDYYALSKNYNIVGAIAIEASPWLGDNFWLIDTLRKDKRVIGFIGNLVPGAANFLTVFEQLESEPLFIGIRYGNLWGYNLSEDIHRPRFVSNLRTLASSSRCLESANPDIYLIKALLTIAHVIPELKIIIDHLPGIFVPVEIRKKFFQYLVELSRNPNVFVKFTQIPIRYAFSSAGTEWLDTIWELFGEDRCFFGSDWPNSLYLTDFHNTIQSAFCFMSKKTLQAKIKFFKINAARAYPCIITN